MIERTVIVPDVDNDGVSLASERASIEQTLLVLAGGFTSDRVRGAWLGHDGTVYTDESTRYTMCLEAAADSEVEQRLPEWCDLLRQQALFTSARAITVTFVLPVRKYQKVG